MFHLRLAVELRVHRAENPARRDGTRSGPRRVRAPVRQQGAGAVLPEPSAHRVVPAYHRRHGRGDGDATRAIGRVAERMSTARPRFVVAAVDIDDTLVGPDGVISADNVAALARLVAEGTRVVLASGRSHANMLPFHRELGLPPGPVISSQGAVVQESDT